MTRHDPPTSSELTVDELREIAVESGTMTPDAVAALCGDLHSANRITSALSFALRRELHQRMMAGTLTLCSRREWPCPAHP